MQPVTPKKRRNPNLILIPAIGIAIILCLLYAAVTGPSKSSGSNPTPTAERAVVAAPTAASAMASAAPTPTRRPATPTPASRCQPAPAILLDSIAEGLTVNGGGDLRNGWTVHSNDFQKAYFVAAEITGSGMGGSVGLWVTNDPNNPTMLFSVNTMAKEFSQWGDGTKTDAAFSQADDGAREALDCAQP